MNCKPGELAIVISAEATPEMIGYVVEVVRQAIDGEMLGKFQLTQEYPHRHSWICRSANGIPMRSTHGNLHIVNERAILDVFLRPITGLPIDEETPTEIKEPA